MVQTGLAILLLSISVTTEAQHASRKLAHVGFLGTDQSASTMPRDKAFLQGLRDLGWIEGQNLTIERRYWENQAERLPAFAHEFIRLNLDVIVTTSGTGAHALKKATSTIPIVM